MRETVIKNRTIVSRACKRIETLAAQQGSRRGEQGIGIVEVIVVIAIIAILSAVAIPQLISARRLHRSAGVPREIMTQMRFARQQALTQRQAFTFRLDLSDPDNKRIVIIDHNDGYNAAGSALLTNNPDVTVRTVPLSGGGISSASIEYGRPPDAPASAETLADGAVMRTVPGNGRINIIFRPDGTVRNNSNLPTSHALLIYNSADAENTAYAVSVLGAAGRIAMWKYNPQPAPDGQIYVRQ